MIEIVDQSNSDLYSQNQDLINNFTDYSSKNLDFDKPVKVYFMDDEENAKDPLGKTGFYNPDTLEIKIYVTGRHLKDILRSISHELIHHVQNCRGDFGSLDSTEAGYAQSNNHLRGMEQEAYTQGNIMNFRDFEDNYKRGTKTMSETKINKLKAMVREGVREVLSEQEVIEISRKTNDPKKEKTIEQMQKEADSICQSNGYARAEYRSSGITAKAYVCKGRKNKEQPSETTADIGPWYDPTGLGPKGSNSGPGKSRYKKCKENIQKGCAGDNVKTIQNLLGVNPDGKFWTNTKKAVQAFQISNGLKPDGIVGEKTLKALVDRRSKQTTGRTPEEIAQAKADAQLEKDLTDARASKIARAATGGPSVDRFPQMSLQDIDNKLADLISKMSPEDAAAALEKVRKAQLQESVTIEQKKLNEAKSLFERLKKVL